MHENINQSAGNGARLRPNVEVDYDFKDDPGNPEWIIRLGLVLLVRAG